MVVNYYNNIFLDKIEKINYIKNGKKKEIQLNKNNLNNINLFFRDVLANSYQMPALGVSVHEYVKHDLNFGEWIEICFSQRQNLEGLEFDGLLLKLEKTGGVNLIRIINGKYSGRNIFLAFENEKDLYELFNKFNF